MAAYNFRGYQFGSSGFQQKYGLGGRAWPGPADASIEKSTGAKHSGPVVKRSKESSLSSTPHAPRVKKPLVALKTNLTTTVPSTHDLLKQHTYLDEGLIKSLSDPSLMEPKKEAIQNDDPLPHPSREAWADPSSSSSSSSSSRPLPASQTSRKVVQPYRRGKPHPPPEGVPLLNLSRFTEPDSQMEPVELIGCDNVEGPPSSLASWGPTATARLRLGHRRQSHTSPPAGEVDDKELTVQDIALAEENIAEHSTASQDHTSAVERLRYVEDKMLSDERGKGLGYVPHSPVREDPPPALFHGGVSTLQPAARLAGQAYRGHMTIGASASESSVNKRLRFEARVLTQNGRDVHRELCGFYFISDGSLSVYEFRQIGKKSSALPFILRGVYSHVLGHKKGQPYEINFIRRGATLHFLTSQHPTLPDTAASKAHLALRITHVDERAKRDLLCEGQKPIECRKIDSYLQQPLSSRHEKDNTLIKTLQGMLCSRLRGRASRCLVGLGRRLARDSEDSGLVGRMQLKQALRDYHISLTLEDFSLLWELLCAGGYSPDSGQGLFADSCLSGLVGEMNEGRKSLVRKVFQKLDSHKTGSIPLTEMRKFFSGAAHPEVASGHMTSDQAWDALFGYLIQDGSSNISYSDFENYYQGVSMETTSDGNFASLLKHCWTL